MESFDRRMVEQRSQLSSQQSLSLTGSPMIEPIGQFLLQHKKKHHQHFDPNMGVSPYSRVKFEMTSIQGNHAQTLQAFKTRLEARNQSNLSTEYPHAKVPPTRPLWTASTRNCSPNSSDIPRPGKVMILQQFALLAKPSLAVTKAQPASREIPELSAAIKFSISQNSNFPPPLNLSPILTMLI